MLEYRSFVKKLVFPLETLPMNLMIAGAVTKAIGLVIFTWGFYAHHAVPLSVLWLPALIDPAVLLTVGFAGFWLRWAYFCATWGRSWGSC